MQPKNEIEKTIFVVVVVKEFNIDDYKRFILDWYCLTYSTRDQIRSDLIIL